MAQSSAAALVFSVAAPAKAVNYEDPARGVAPITQASRFYSFPHLDKHPMPDARSVQRLRRLAARARTLAAVYIVVLFVATHVPTISVDRLTLSDKFYHLGAYAVLTLCVLAGWELTIRRLEPKHYFAVWLAGTLYAAMDEVTQVPVGRSCDINDWAADVLGIVIGIIVFRLVRMSLYRTLMDGDVRAMGS
jgi:VanZ family protein